MAEIVLQICKSFAWKAVINDSYGSHVLRIVICILSGRSIAGVAVESKKCKNFKSQNTAAVLDTLSKNNRKVPPEFTREFEDLLHDFTESTNVHEARMYAIDPLSSVVLQQIILIKGVSHPLINKILESKPDSQPYACILLKDRIGSHLVEKIIDESNHAEYSKMFKDYFVENLVDLAMNSVANFPVQRLIGKTDEYHAEIMLDKLLPEFKNLIENNRSGVVEKLVKVCSSPALGEKCAQGIWECLEIDSDVIACVCSLKSSSVYFWLTQEIQFLHPSRMISLQGSLIMQHLCTYPPAVISKIQHSISTLSVEKMVEYAKHKSISRVMETIFKSSCFSIDFKLSLCERLSDCLVDLARDVYGCHVVEKCWEAMDTKGKGLIVKQLISARDLVEGSKYGAIVMKKCKIHAWSLKSSGKESAIDRKRRLFADIL